ncbi:MAG: methyltransferase [Desulfurispora sp.]|uniref:methyltransferase n=1 Tax=Desulfurispora sp. TaxID=3014275 RepID=UPI00404B47A9
MPDPQSWQIPRELLILGGAVESGLLDYFRREGRHQAGEIAGALSADARAVWTVCEALVALGYLDKNEQGFALLPAARDMFFNPHSPHYTGYAFMHQYNLLSRWLTLPAVLQSGQPAPRERTPQHQGHFMAAMQHTAKKSAPVIVPVCLEGLPPGPRVLDIGGGPLTYARAFAAAGASVTVLDLPAVVEMMRPELGPAENIRLVAGDFNQGLPQGPFDLALLGNICHIYGAEENIALFQRVHHELSPGGRIAIVDLFRDQSPQAAIFAVNMLVNTEKGGTWTLAQYTDWLNTAGFTDVQYYRVEERELLTAARPC